LLTFFPQVLWIQWNLKSRAEGNILSGIAQTVNWLDYRALIPDWVGFTFSPILWPGRLCSPRHLLLKWAAVKTTWVICNLFCITDHL
jgi:hypothetical protein